MRGLGLPVDTGSYALSSLRDCVPDGGVFLRVYTGSYALSPLSRLICLRGLRSAG